MSFTPIKTDEPLLPGIGDIWRTKKNSEFVRVAAVVERNGLTSAQIAYETKTGKKFSLPIETFVWLFSETSLPPADHAGDIPTNHFARLNNRLAGIQKPKGK